MANLQGRLEFITRLNTFTVATVRFTEPVNNFETLTMAI